MLIDDQQPAIWMSDRPDLAELVDAEVMPGLVLFEG